MKRTDWITIVITCAGVAMIVIGALSGEARTIMSSAIRICLECIGIG